MPNENGMIYCVRHTDFDEGVNVVSDIASVLGENSSDVSTLCESKSINVHAKYKPLPPLSVYESGLNVRRPLTEEERNELGNGIRVFFDLWSARYDQLGMADLACEYLNNGKTYDDLSLARVEWQSEGVYHRTSDFMPSIWIFERKSIPYNEKVYGYYHGAKPYSPTFLYGSNRYTLEPIIRDGDRSMEIEEGKTLVLEIPDDRMLLRCAVGDLKDSSTVEGNTLEQRLSLSIYEEMVGALRIVNLQGSNQNLTTDSRRCVVVLTKDYFGNWIVFGTVENTGASQSYGVGVQISDHIDMNDATQNLHAVVEYDALSDFSETYIYNYGTTKGQVYGENGRIRTASWRDLKGTCVFFEYYTGFQGSARVSNIPIPGLIYEVEITRVEHGQSSDVLDIAGNVYIYNSYTDGNAAAIEVHVTREQGEFTSMEQLSAYLSTQYTSLACFLSNDADGEYAVTGTIDILSANDWLFEMFSTSKETDGTLTYAYNIVKEWPNQNDAEYLYIKGTKRSSGAVCVKRIRI